jgi:hypothetical protein
MSKQKLSGNGIGERSVAGRCSKHQIAIQQRV